MTNGFLQIDCVCVCQDKACPNQSTVKIWHVSSLFYIPNESSPTGYLFKRCAWMCNSLSTIESGHCINRNFFVCLCLIRCWVFHEIMTIIHCIYICTVGLWLHLLKQCRSPFRNACDLWSFPVVTVTRIYEINLSLCCISGKWAFVSRNKRIT